jgi:hypothetical protein
MRDEIIARGGEARRNMSSKNIGKVLVFTVEED